MYRGMWGLSVLMWCNLAHQSASFRRCYGSEFTSMAILKWVQGTGIDWHYIAPGKLQQNGFIESFNGKLRPSHACKHTLPVSGLMLQ